MIAMYGSLNRHPRNAIRNAIAKEKRELKKREREERLARWNSGQAQREAQYEAERYAKQVKAHGEAIKRAETGAIWDRLTPIAGWPKLLSDLVEEYPNTFPNFADADEN